MTTKEMLNSLIEGVEEKDCNLEIDLINSLELNLF